MKHFALICSLAIMTFSSQVRALADDQTLRKEIESAEKKWMEYWNTRNIDALANLYLVDAERFVPEKGIVKGRDAIRKHLQGSRKESGDNSEKVVTLDVYGQGDIATETGTWRDQTPEGELTEEGTYIMVWQKQEGDWKVRREIWTTTTKGGTLAEPLQVLKPYLGSWTSEGKNPEGQGNVRCTFTWKPLVDGKAVLSEGTVWIDGKVVDQWASIMYYNNQTKTLAESGVNRTGQGRSTIHLLGNKLVFQSAGADAEGEGQNVDQLSLEGNTIRYSQLAAFINGKPREQLMKDIEFRRE
jgi:ketosteroid isomerase-like protein